MNNKRKLIISAIVQFICWLLLIGLDLSTKAAAAAGLKGRPPVMLIPGVLELYYLENTGAAFSMLENAQWLFILIAAAAIAVIAWILWKLPRTRHFLPLHILLTLISAGAAGNLIDRISLHYVRDFIYFVIIDFPVFNVADMYVTVSTVLLVIYVVFFYKDEDFRSSGKK